jgi:hypothetical protein
VARVYIPGEAAIQRRPERVHRALRATVSDERRDSESASEAKRVGATRRTVMESAYLSAVAALAGSAVGGLTSLTASWLTQRVQVSAQLIAHDASRREELYKDFIEEASNTYAGACERNEVDIARVVRLYALVSRMRVLSSPRVVEQADAVMRLILKTYRAPNHSIGELAANIDANVLNPELDPLRDFSDACRDERQLAYGIGLRRNADRA